MSNFKFPELKRFCYCMSLVNGVRVMTGLALIVGDAYIILGAGLYDDYIPFFIVTVCALSYYITGGLFCLWFLLLLVFQSTSSKYPRIMVLWHTKLLAAWLLFMFFLLLLSLYILHRNKELIAAYYQDKELLVYGILVTVFGIVSTSYNFLILQSYVNTLEEARRQSTSSTPSVRILSYISEELEDRISELPKLSAMNSLQRDRMMKRFKNEYQKKGIMPPLNIRASQISVLSDSHVSLISALSSSHEEEKERQKTSENKESDLSPMKQNEKNESPPMKQSRWFESSPLMKGRENESPPMKMGRENESSSPKQSKESEASPPKQGKENESPPMKQGKESEPSPPKQGKESKSSPPKQSNENESSPPKQGKDRESSPPKQGKESKSSPPKQSKEISKESEPSYRKPSGESESSSRKQS